MSSTVRQNYPLQCEAALNRMINLKLIASNFYLCMATYFDRADVALPNLSLFLTKASTRERDSASNMMRYQNKRGGKVVFANIEKPNQTEWKNAHEAMNTVLRHVKDMNEALLELHQVATKNEDQQFCDYIEDEHSSPQTELIKEVADHLTNLKRVGQGLGEYTYDHESLGN